MSTNEQKGVLQFHNGKPVNCGVVISKILAKEIILQDGTTLEDYVNNLNSSVAELTETVNSMNASVAPLQDDTTDTSKHAETSDHATTATTATNAIYAERSKADGGFYISGHLVTIG